MLECLLVNSLASQLWLRVTTISLKSGSMWTNGQRSFMAEDVSISFEFGKSYFTFTKSFVSLLSIGQANYTHFYDIYLKLALDNTLVLKLCFTEILLLSYCYRLMMPWKIVSLPKLTHIKRIS